MVQSWPGLGVRVNLPPPPPVIALPDRPKREPGDIFTQVLYCDGSIDTHEGIAAACIFGGVYEYPGTGLFTMAVPGYFVGPENAELMGIITAMRCIVLQRPSKEDLIFILCWG